MGDSPSNATPLAGNEGNMIFELHREIEDNGNREKWQAAQLEIMGGLALPAGQQLSFGSGAILLRSDNLYCITGYPRHWPDRRLALPCPAAAVSPSPAARIKLGV